MGLASLMLAFSSINHPTAPEGAAANLMLGLSCLRFSPFGGPSTPGGRVCPNDWAKASTRLGGNAGLFDQDLDPSFYQEKG